MADVVLLIPAAGAASRMRGADKLLEPVDGQPQLARVVGAALDTRCRVLVTLPALDGPRAGVVRPHENLETLAVPDAAEGMAASLRAGAKAAGNPAGLMIIPADMPELETDDFLKLIARFSYDPEIPVRATAQDGTPGHPVILPRRLLPLIATLCGDQGARRLLDGERITHVALPGRRALIDLDTPEDWAHWRAGRD